MTITFKICWDIFSLSTIKATVSLLQWQRQASSFTLLKQSSKWVCYNKHFLQSTSQRVCYKKLLKKHEQSSFTLSAYEKTLIDLKADEWFIAKIRISLIKEEKWCYDYVAASCFAKQLSSDCCSNGLTLNSNFYILNSFLLYLLFMLLFLVNYIHIICFYADSDRFCIIERRIMRAYNEIFAIIKKNYDDDIFMNTLIKNVCRVAYMRKEIKQWYRVCNMIVAINYVAYY